MDEGRIALSRRTRLFAVASGACVALFAWLSGNSAVFPPELWDDISVAAGLRPPPGVLPCFWRHAVSLSIGAFGLENTLLVLRVLGPLSLGALFLMSFFLFSELIPGTLRLKMQRWRWGRRLVAAVLAQGALCFVMSEPVWSAGRALTPAMAQLLVAVGVMHVFWCALTRSGPGLAIGMSAFIGFCAADATLAFIVPIAFVAVAALLLHDSNSALGVPLRNPLLRFVQYRRMAAAFFFAWIGGVWANAHFFFSHGGLEAHEWSQVMYLLQYLYAYVLDFQSLARPLGWLLMFFICVAPLVVAARYAGRATDDDKVLPYHLALFYVVAGVFLFTQSAGLPAFWFWRWIRTPALVSSGMLLGIGLLMTSATVTLSLCVGGVALYYRNNKRLLQIRFEDVAASTKGWRRAVESFRMVGRAARAALVLLPALTVAILTVSRFSPIEHGMSGVVDEYLRDTAEECGDAKILFSDGAMDAAIEVQAMRQGRGLKVVSMMSKDDDVYSGNLRRRGETDKEDADMLAAGASGALRTWVRDKPDRATNIAVQIGFELWRRNGLKSPEPAGLVARTAGFPPAERQRMVERARALAGRVFAVCEAGVPDESPNARLRDMFTVVEWRLARLCRMRADEADKAGRADDALRDTELANALDDVNAAYGRVRRQMDWTELRPDTRLTAREGLALWLGKGDFRMARLYAQQILRANPQDSRANFAVGMSYFVEEQYNRAEAYLARSLAEHPNEPAALNNLAVVQAKLGRLEEAETNAMRALSRLPDSKEVNSTLNEIRKRLAASDAASKKATAKPQQSQSPAAANGDAPNPLAEEPQKMIYSTKEGTKK